jgi:hypothetical protein
LGFEYISQHKHQKITKHNNYRIVYIIIYILLSAILYSMNQINVLADRAYFQNHRVAIVSAAHVERYIHSTALPVYEFLQSALSADRFHPTLCSAICVSSSPVSPFRVTFFDTSTLFLFVVKGMLLVLFICLRISAQFIRFSGNFGVNISLLEILIFLKVWRDPFNILILLFDL